MLTEQHITEFQKLWREEFGEDISRERAIEEGLRLVQLVGIVNNLIKYSYE